VHEAWLRLAGDGNRKWNDRTHFFAAAAEAMRRILVENARRKRAQRHGGGQQRLELLDLAAPQVPNADLLLAVNDALDKFAALDPQTAELVKLRYFVGMTIEETAEALGISKATVKRHWDYARAWLYEEIRTQQAGEAAG
jgi:RNA polymerase sigma factor (TIGR02999 family)